MGLFEEDTCDRSGRKYVTVSQGISEIWPLFMLPVFCTTSCMCCVLNFGCGTYMSRTFPVQLQWKVVNVCPLTVSAFPHVTAQEPLDDYDTWNLIQDSLTNVLSVSISVFVKTGQHWYTLYMKTCVCFLVHLKCN